MAEIQIAWLELMTVGGLGVILVLLGVTFNIIVKRQNKLCTKKTDGIVKQYGFPGNGRVYPIVEYFVNGTCYKAKKKFRGIITTQLSGVPVPMKSEVYEDEKGWLHVKTGAIANLRQFAEQLWPINSKMTVFFFIIKLYQRKSKHIFFVSTFILQLQVFYPSLSFTSLLTKDISALPLTSGEIFFIISPISFCDVGFTSSNTLSIISVSSSSDNCLGI